MILSWGKELCSNQNISFNVLTFLTRYDSLDGSSIVGRQRWFRRFKMADGGVDAGASSLYEG